MRQLSWNESLSIDHETIDAQHETLFYLICEIFEAINESAELSTLLKYFSQLERYADFHFNSEEVIMLENNYPDYAAHKRQHVMLFVNLEYQLNRVRAGEMETIELIDFLYDWFTIHVKGADKKLADYLKANP